MFLVALSVAFQKSVLPRFRPMQLLPHANPTSRLVHSLYRSPPPFLSDPPGETPSTAKWCKEMSPLDPGVTLKP